MNEHAFGGPVADVFLSEWYKKEVLEHRFVFYLESFNSMTKSYGSRCVKGVVNEVSGRLRFDDFCALSVVVRGFVVT